MTHSCPRTGRIDEDDTGVSTAVRTARPGVLLTALGAPSSPEEIEPFYARVQSGGSPSPDRLADLVARYESIGGPGSISAISEAQRHRIEHHFIDHLRIEIPVVLGQLYSAPFIGDAIERLADEDVTHMVAVTLMPQYSKAGVGECLAEANETRLRHGIEMLPVEHWHLLVGYLDHLVATVGSARAGMPERHAVLFAARPFPQLAPGDDPYPDELRRSAQIVTGELGLEEFPSESGGPGGHGRIADRSPVSGWSMAWRRGDDGQDVAPGPDIVDAMRTLHTTHGIEGVIVCPLGSSSDDLGILHGLDIEAAAIAHDLDMGFARTASVNDTHSVMSALAELIAARLRRRRLI